MAGDQAASKLIMKVVVRRAEIKESTAASTFSLT
jgi:hypothetical protein